MSKNHVTFFDFLLQKEMDNILMFQIFEFLRQKYAH